MDIGRRIKERRIFLNLSVDDLASILKKNRATIYRYESNEIENFPVGILEPLAKVLQTTPAYLMGWTDDPSMDVLHDSGKVPNDSSKKYFLNDEAASLAQEIYENPELRILFDTTRKVDPEDLRLITKMVSKMVKEENGEED